MPRTRNFGILAGFMLILADAVAEDTSRGAAGALFASFAHKVDKVDNPTVARIGVEQRDISCKVCCWCIMICWCSCV